MNKNVLDLISDSSRQMANMATDLAVQSHDLYMRFFEISLEQQPEYGQRASRVFFHSSILKPEWLDPLVPHIVEILPELQSDSVTRNLLRIFTERPLPSDEKVLGHLASFCFSVIEGEPRSVAVEVYALTILSKLAGMIPELGDELILILNGKLDHPSAAISSRSRHLIRKLKYGAM